MKTFSFIHAADLHLDSPFTGLCAVDEELGKILRESTFRAFDGIVDMCIEREVDFLVISGDVYDGADRSLRAQLAFREGLKKLAESGISCFVVHGNHDALDSKIASIEWPELITFFGGENVEFHPVVKEGMEVARIYGISYPTCKVEENLAVKFEKDDDSPFAVGVLHCNVGSDTGHENYAPCTTDDLIKAGMDYWALGHVHTRVTLNESDPMIAYPGNTQARSPVETGPRGCLHIEVDEAGKPHAEFVPVDLVRWVIRDVDVEDVETDEELLQKLDDACEEIKSAAEGRSIVARLILKGTTPMHRELSEREKLSELENVLREEQGRAQPFVWIDRLTAETSPDVDIEALEQRNDFVGELLKEFKHALTEGEQIEFLNESLEPLFGSHKWKKHAKPVDDAKLNEWLEQARMICLAHFAGDEE